MARDSTGMKIRSGRRAWVGLLYQAANANLEDASLQRKFFHLGSEHQEGSILQTGRETFRRGENRQILHGRQVRDYGHRQTLRCALTVSQSCFNTSSRYYEALARELNNSLIDRCNTARSVVEPVLYYVIERSRYQYSFVHRLSMPYVLGLPRTFSSHATHVHTHKKTVVLLSSAWQAFHCVSRGPGCASQSCRQYRGGNMLLSQ